MGNTLKLQITNFMLFIPCIVTNQFKNQPTKCTMFFLKGSRRITTFRVLIQHKHLRKHLHILLVEL
jgi:hypothetical protein